jgi:hypothetical protein
MAPHIPVMAPRPDATPNPKASGRAMKATVIPASVSWAILLPIIRMRGQGFMSERNPLIVFPRRSIDVVDSYSKILCGLLQRNEGTNNSQLIFLTPIMDKANCIPDLSLFSLRKQSVNS